MDEILVNPITAIKLFAKTYLSVGDDILNDSKYKVTREAWIAAMFLVGISKETNSEWWLTSVTDKSGSPDFNCYTFLRNIQKQTTDRPQMKVEVFEWRNEQKEDNFIEALKNIKLNKIVDPQITLVCYIRRNSVIPSANDLNSVLKKISPRVKDIWYLGDVSSDAKEWRLTQIFPNTMAIDLDFDEILKTKEDHKFIYSYRGMSDKIEFETSGKQVRLTPEFDIQIID